MITRRTLMPESKRAFEDSQRARLQRACCSPHLGLALIAAMIGLSGCSGTPVSNTCNANSVGGEGATSCASGGTVSTGGVEATGGATTGGEVTTGGVEATGGAATGGEVSTGGVEATGGEVSTGGVEATGGEVSTGGTEATGGAPTTGGTSSIPPQAILKYDFEDGSGGSAADSTPNTNNGTLSGSVTWSDSGRTGKAVSFAAGDASVTMPTGILTGAHALTVSAWVNLTASAAENRLFYFGTDTTYLTLVLNNSGTPAGMSLRFQGPTGGELVLTSPTQLPTTGVWKYVTVTLSTAGAAMYVDGKIVAQDNTLSIDPSTLGSTTTNLVGSSPTAQVFQGTIDEFYMYNYVLPLTGAPPDDIRTLAWPKTDYSVYHLDEDTGTTTADSSDRHYDGTLVGEPARVDGAFGRAVNLSNSATTVPAQQYVQLLTGNVKDCTTTLTVSAWINLTSNTTAAPFFEFAKDSSTYINTTTYAASGSYIGPVLSFVFARSATKVQTLRKTGATWTNGNWTHVAVVRGWDNANKVIDTTGYQTTIFQNAVALAGATIGTAASITGTLLTPTLDYLGRSYNPATPGFDGAIDEVLISCRPYTADEISQLAYKP